MTTTADTKPIDKYIPWMFVAFFVVIAAVNAVFVTFALKTHSGTVTDSAYERGLAYNATLEAAKKQEELGWSAKLSYENTVLKLVLTDRSGNPVVKGKATAEITRPVTSGFDQTLDLSEAEGGAYTANVTLPLSGQWHVRIDVNADGQAYQVNQTLMIP